MMFSLPRRLSLVSAMYHGAQAVSVAWNIASRARVPAAIEDHDLATGRKVLDVPLRVELGLLPLRRRRQRDDAKHAGGKSKRPGA